MIHESGPWKERLAKDADLLERWSGKRSTTNRRSVLLEQKVFVAAYAIRKLLEGRKLSSAFDGLSVEVTAFPLRAGQAVSPRNNHRFDRLYDMDAGTAQRLAFPRLIDTIIHSLVFVECIRDDLTVEGFMVTSDKRSSTLMSVDLNLFLKLLRAVASDYPSSGRWTTDPDTGEVLEWRGHGEPPPDIAARFHAIGAKYKSDRQE
jgi:hypothetical protein